MDLSCTASEINVISVENRKFFPPTVYFTPPMTAFPLDWVSAQGVKKLEWWGYWAKKEVWRHLQPSGYNPIWRTDWHRATATTAFMHGVMRWKKTNKKNRKRTKI